MNNNGSRSQLIRFGLVGGLNTLIDIGLFHVLANIVGLNFFVANIISTGIALSFSYIMHSRFTFGSNPGSRGIVAFIGVTLFGLWLLQPIVIALIQPLSSPFFTQEVSLLIGKLVATIVSLVWNFIGYKYIVFAPSKRR